MKEQSDKERVGTTTGGSDMPVGMATRGSDMAVGDLHSAQPPLSLSPSSRQFSDVAWSSKSSLPASFLPERHNAEREREREREREKREREREREGLH